MLICRGGACTTHRTRSCESFFTMEVLYQLSYVGASPDPIGIGTERDTFSAPKWREPDGCVSRA
jgi:hypothetical protein